MTPREKRQVAAVTVSLADGPYKIQPAPLSGAVVEGPDGKAFCDVHGNPIKFHTVDAEKIARLYNQDAHDT